MSVDLVFPKQSIKELSIGTSSIYFYIVSLIKFLEIWLKTWHFEVVFSV